MGGLDPNNRAADILRDPEEGGRLFFLLVDYANRVARRYGWTTGRVLPHALEPDAIVKNVIIKVLQGERTWDETGKHTLLNALKGMVRSEINHVFNDLESQRVESIQTTMADGRERGEDDFPSTALNPDALNPEQLLLDEETHRLEFVALDLILKEVEGSPQLETVFLALHEAHSDQELAQITELPIERIYSIRRELNRIARRITPARVAREARERAKS